MSAYCGTINRRQNLPGMAPYLDSEHPREYPWGMPKHLYILSADRPFSEKDLNRIKDEICRLFDCTEISVADAKVFTIHSPLGLKDMERLAIEAAMRFGLHLKAGGELK